jgi:endo-1,4-beta-xylanase
MSSDVTKPRSSLGIIILLASSLAVPAAMPELRAEDGKEAPAAGGAGADRVSPEVVFLWPAGSPTLQGPDEKEITDPADPQPGQRIKSIKNVHNPSLEVRLPPAEKAVGTAIIVAPGGGHRQLVWGSEGTDIADWLNGMGVAAFILKYRLEQTPGYQYTVEKEALEDTQRAVRIVRLRAREWGVDPARVGILGFSAGGALAAYANIRFDSGDPKATDPVGEQSSRPDFVGLVYPGWKRMDSEAPKDAAPAFLTSAGLDDEFHARQTVEYHNMLFRAKVPSDLHIYAHGGHGGAISRRNGIPFGAWHVRFEEWLADLGRLKAAK